MTKKRNFSRRAFIGTSALGVAGLTLLPGCAVSATEPLKVGFIGVGRQAMYLLSSFINIEGIKIVACADVYGIKRKRFEKRVSDHYLEQGVESDVKSYEDYKDLLARKDIDAVVIASPDHWHAHMAIDASNAGKDIYLEKPLTFSIKEGQKLIKTVRANNTILAVGSQQRSDASFQHAVKMVQEGRLGKLEKINVHIGSNPHPTPYDAPEMELPADLNWDMWLGPNPYVHYNEILNPAISLDPPKDETKWGAWRWVKETGGGLMTDWGAHMIDIAQWGIKKDLSGPSKVIPAGYEGAEFLTYVYEDGLEMTLEPFDGGTRGVKFWGSEGWIEISRDKFVASSEDLNPVVEDTDVPYEARAGHHQNFIDSVKSRQDPIVTVEIGHRTNSACVMANIAHELARPIEWDASNENFGDDEEANAFIDREYSEGYTM